MGRPNRDQHAVPRFYIAGFAGDGGRVNVWDCKRKNSFPALPDSLATEDECFTIITDRKRDMSCDDTNSEVEKQFAPLIQSLQSTKSPTTEQWQAIWVLTANLICRSRNARDMVNEAISKSSDAVEAIMPILDKLELPDSIQQVFGRTVLKDDTLDQLKRAKEVQYPLTAGIGLLPVAEELKSKPVNLLIAPPSCRFITSDDPVVVIKNDEPVEMKFKNGFIADSETSVYLPLKPNIACLWGNGDPFSVQQISIDECKRYNRMVVDSCYMQVYAQTADDLNSIG